MKKRPRKGMFRDFKMRSDDTIGDSYCKYHRLVIRDLVNSTEASEAQINFMIFIYDYEFFTLDHISEKYFYSKVKLSRRLVYPLQNKRYIYQYYSKLKPNSYEDAIFEESKHKYRIRYALTERGRLLVRRYYRKLEGREQINVPF